MNSTSSYLVLEDWLKKSSILKGSVMSVVVLAAGSAVEGQSGLMAQFSIVGYAGGVLGLILALLAGLTAHALDRRVLRSLRALEHRPA